MMYLCVQQFWYFELVETCRKLFLASALSVISPGSTFQLVVAVLFCMISLVIYTSLDPYDDAELAMTSSMCQLQVWFILFISILIREEVGMSSAFINVSVVLAVCLVVVYEVFWIIVEFLPLPKQVDRFLNNFTRSKSRQSEALSNAATSAGDHMRKATRLLQARDTDTDSHDKLTLNYAVTKDDSLSSEIGKLNHRVAVLQRAHKRHLRDERQCAKLGLALDDDMHSTAVELKKIQRRKKRVEKKILGGRSLKPGMELLKFMGGDDSDDDSDNDDDDDDNDDDDDDNDDSDDSDDCDDCDDDDDDDVDSDDSDDSDDDCDDDVDSENAV